MLTTNPGLARRGTDGLALIGPTRADVCGIRFFNDDGGADGGPKSGFPANTPVDQMTPEEKAAYWRAESKKHQKVAAKYEKLGDVDTVAQALEDAEKTRNESLTEQQKAVADATKAGETAGYEKARDLFAKPAISAILQTRVKRPGETDQEVQARVEGVIGALNVTAFLNEDGALDAAKVETFAQSLAPSDGDEQRPGNDPIADALRRQHQNPHGHGGSIASMEEEHFKRLTNQS